MSVNASASSKIFVGWTWIAVGGSSKPPHADIPGAEWQLMSPDLEHTTMAAFVG
jgi:hypothetical protein